MTAKLDGTNGLIQQYDYQTPTTGFSYTFAAGTTVLVMNPAGTLATGTITMPAAPVDGMTISFSSTQAITALTVAGNTGQSIVGNPSTMNAGGAATFVYRLSNTTWYAQTSTANLALSTGVPVINVYTTPGAWTKPTTVKAIKVTVVGGGNTGGPSSTAPSRGGGGGGAGGAAIKIYPAPSLPGPQPYTVGAAGATSSFGVAPVTVVSATGGAAASTSSGGAGGAGSNGDLNITGGQGTGSYAFAPTPGISIAGGAGGASIFGANGGGSPTTTVAGGAYGGGGGGGSGGPGPGGAGFQGVVIVEEFY